MIRLPTHSLPWCARAAPVAGVCAVAITSQTCMQCKRAQPCRSGQRARGTGVLQLGTTFGSFTASGASCSIAYCVFGGSTSDPTVRERCPVFKSRRRLSCRRRSSTELLCGRECRRQLLCNSLQLAAAAWTGIVGTRPDSVNACMRHLRCRWLSNSSRLWQSLLRKDNYSRRSAAHNTCSATPRLLLCQRRVNGRLQRRALLLRASQPLPAGHWHADQPPALRPHQAVLQAGRA